MNLKTKKQPIPHKMLPERLQKLLPPITEIIPEAHIDVFRREEVGHFNRKRKRKAALQLTCHSSESNIKIELNRIHNRASSKQWLTQFSVNCCDEEGGLTSTRYLSIQYVIWSHHGGMKPLTLTTCQKILVINGINCSLRWQRAATNDI